LIINSRENNIVHHFNKKLYFPANGYPAYLYIISYKTITLPFMKRSICFICFVYINIISLKAQTLRNTIALNGIWRFISDPANAGQAKLWINGLPAGAVNVTIPHAWNVMKGFEDHSDPAWDEKIFTLPAQYRNKQFRLRFEAIYRDAVIYLNGVQLATHINAGYTSIVKGSKRG
jgi:beta-galactosidase